MILMQPAKGKKAPSNNKTRTTRYIQAGGVDLRQQIHVTDAALVVNSR
jgi:hypothetical protein